MKAAVQALERHYRRLMMMVARGRVMLGSDSGNVGRVQVRLNDRETIDQLVNAQQYGFASAPLPGADAIVVFQGGDRSNGIVIATGDQRYRFQLVGGEAAIFDNQGRSVHLAAAGIVIEGNTSPVRVHSTATVTIDAPKTAFTGDLTVQGISFLEHVHPGVQSGGSKTDPPTAS